MKPLLLFLLGGIVLTAVSRSSLPRGIRNNNPGNIRRTNDQWQGLQTVQNDPDFFQFSHPRYGFRAMARILRNYQRRGLTTIEMISTYAPATENKTETYINFVTKKLNLSPDSEVNLNKKLFDLIKAITTFENGFRFISFYNDNTIQEGIALAWHPIF